MDARDRTKWAVVLACVFAAIGLAVLFRGNPHEDAFILFRYANNVAAGHGVVYYPGGPHAEGATDFLWMLALALGRVARVDPAFGAVVLDAFGFFVIAREMLRFVPSEGPRRTWLLAFVAAMLVSPAALAGYLGFSATLYSALALVLMRTYLEGEITSLPGLALLLGLVRPDGVVLGGAFVALGLLRAKSELRRYVFACVSVLFVGAAYFMWRWKYFGELLPLPLVVKSHREALIGSWPDFRDWAAACMLPPLAVIGASRALLGRAKIDAERQLWIALAPFAVHVGSFAVGVTTQNVANRFQAPATLALAYVALRIVSARLDGDRADARRRVVVGALAIAALYPTFVLGRRAFEDAFAVNYVNVLAREARAVVQPDDRIATTEAGRLPYWTSARTWDLVGLNTAETAHRPPTRALLDEWSPDIVMIHHAGAIDEALLDGGSRDPIVPVHARMSEVARPWAKPLLTGELPAYGELKLENVLAASLGTLGWLETTARRYEVYAVWFDSRFVHRHLFAIRADYPRKEAFLQALRRAQESPRASYVELVRGR